MNEYIRKSDAIEQALAQIHHLDTTVRERILNFDGKAQAKTNADRIRAMTDEELATVIAWPYLASPPWCGNHTTCPYISEDPTPCDKCALDWLKQEAKT